MISSNLEKALQVLEQAPRSQKKLTPEMAYFDLSSGAACSCGYLALSKGLKPINRHSVKVIDGEKSCYDAIRAIFNLSEYETDCIIFANAVRKTFKGVANLIRKMDADRYKLRQMAKDANIGFP